MEEIKKKILAEYDKGNVVFAGAGSLQVSNLEEFINQPTEALLYDLNRHEMIVMAFIEDPKWVNDYAVCKVIRALKDKISQLEEILSTPTPNNK